MMLQGDCLSCITGIWMSLFDFQYHYLHAICSTIVNILSVFFFIAGFAGNIKVLFPIRKFVCQGLRYHRQGWLPSFLFAWIYMHKGWLLEVSYYVVWFIPFHCIVSHHVWYFVIILTHSSHWLHFTN